MSWVLAWAASVQLAQLYKEKSELGSNSAAVIIFRDDVIKFLVDKIILQFEGDGCYEEDHYKNIDVLITYANEVDPGVLGETGYKYGVAQKLLNLALKYYWCLGLVNEPPHCPIDRIIIGKTILRGKVNWTQITERSQYEKIIREIKLLAGRRGSQSLNGSLSAMEGDK